MATTTVSMEELRNDPDKVGEASAEGPVFVTRPGQRTLVVLDIEEYRKLSGSEPKDRKLPGKEPNILQLLAMPGVGEIEFEPPHLTGNSLRPADFSD